MVNASRRWRRVGAASTPTRYGASRRVLCVSTAKRQSRDKKVQTPYQTCVMSSMLPGGSLVVLVAAISAPAISRLQRRAPPWPWAWYQNVPAGCVWGSGHLGLTSRALLV